MTRFKATALATAALFLGTAVFAHAEVSNPAVKARMDAMKAIGGAMKTLSTMAKGEAEFSAEAANAALAIMAEQAAAVPALFEAQEDDPESDAADEIWTNWDDFVAKAKALETAASSANIAGPDDIGAAMGAVGGTCKACHSDYKL